MLSPPGRRARVGALLLGAACVLLPRPAAAGLGVVQNLVFAGLSDWGGCTGEPYTTGGQLSAAGALARVAETAKPRLVVSAGGNFLDQGLPGACTHPSEWGGLLRLCWHV
jgi:hypothetical protein